MQTIPRVLTTLAAAVILTIGVTAQDTPKTDDASPKEFKALKYRLIGPQANSGSHVARSIGMRSSAGRREPGSPRP